MSPGLCQFTFMLEISHLLRGTTSQTGEEVSGRVGVQITPTCMSGEMSDLDLCLCDHYTCNHQRSCGQSSNSAPGSDDVGRWWAATELWSRDMTWTLHVPKPLAGCARPVDQCNTPCQRCTFFDFLQLLSHSSLYNKLLYKR